MLNLLTTFNRSKTMVCGTVVSIAKEKVIRDYLCKCAEGNFPRVGECNNVPTMRVFTDAAIHHLNSASLPPRFLSWFTLEKSLLIHGKSIEALCSTPNPRKSTGDRLSPFLRGRILPVSTQSRHGRDGPKTNDHL